MIYITVILYFNIVFQLQPNHCISQHHSPPENRPRNPLINHQDNHRVIHQIDLLPKYDSIELLFISSLYLHMSGVIVNDFFLIKLKSRAIVVYSYFLYKYIYMYKYIYIHIYRLFIFEYSYPWMYVYMHIYVFQLHSTSRNLFLSYKYMNTYMCMFSKD